jgi:hypothetical protein
MEIMVSTMMEKNAMARARAISVIAFPLPGSFMNNLHYRATEPSGRPSEEVMEGRERYFMTFINMMRNVKRRKPQSIL